MLLAVFGVCAVADWWAVATANRRLEYVFKPAALAALLAVSLALDPVYADRRTWFAIALALSLMGDVFLMLPHDLFVAGLGSFLLAHLAYVVGFTRHGGSFGAIAAAAVPVVVVAAVIGTRYVRALREKAETELVVPVVAYVAVIAAMATTALASGNWLAGAGAVLFMTSDALIGYDRFVTPRAWAPLAIIVTYHLGQLGLTLSLLR